MALVVTTILFMLLPMLTQFQKSYQKRQRVYHVLISQRRPPPPPEPERDKKIEQKEIKKPKKAQKRTQPTRPKIDVPRANLGAGLGGTIQISGLLSTDFKVSDSLFVTAFSPNEVDQPPSTLSVFEPRYPFEARQKGIEGWVTLRFVVDSKGRAQEPQVRDSEPEGTFEEAALEAVSRYRFRPAYKGGKAVDCIAKLTIRFNLNE